MSERTKRKTVYFDIDGTMAEWKEAKCLAELMRKGYFRSLAPTILAEFANQLSCRNDLDVYSLSAYIPESYALEEKMEWLDEYTPLIHKDHRLYVPNGVNKAMFVEEALRRPLQKTDILVDDYTLNLSAWEEAGGTAIKWLNGINGLGGNFAGPRVGTTEELARLLAA